MPITRAEFVRSSLIWLVLGLLALASVIVANIWLVQRTQNDVEEVLDARRLRAAAIDVRSIMQDAETGQRGYLITGDDTYLQPYNTAMAKMTPALDRLRQLSAPLPDIAGRVAELGPVLQDKLAELTETIDLARQGRSDEALNIVRTDQGRQVMDRARAQFEEIITRAEARLTEVGAAQAQSANALWWVTVFGGLAVLLFTVLGILTIFRYLRELSVARAERDALNAELEDRVKERTAELGQANEEIQRFAYIVTHDLRAPLVNIMGFTAELEASASTLQGFMAGLELDPDNPESQAAKLAAEEDLPEAVGFIRSSTRKMDGLINAILKISRDGRRTLKPERLDLKALVDGAIAAISHQLTQADGEASVDIAVPMIVSDRLSLEQIIGNMLDNAVKYRDPARPLRIAIRAHGVSAGRIRIEIEDNGRGIAPQDHQRVFELFRRSGQQNQPGEGIGLAHVRSLARNLGGDVTLRSTFGQGTVLTIIMPADLRAVVGSVAA